MRAVAKTAGKVSVAARERDDAKSLWVTMRVADPVALASGEARVGILGLCILCLGWGQIQ